MLLPLLLGGVALIGCSGKPAVDFTDCGTPGCRHQWALSRWETDPEAVALAVAAHNDPVEQMALIQAISEQHPGQVMLTQLMPETLEALSRSNPPQTGLLVQALSHSDERVRRTAAQLLGSDPSNAETLAALSTDPSSLVRGRATP